MIIFDCGSGNTCENDVNKAREMVFEIAKLKIPGTVIKWQLFTRAGENMPLKKEVYEAARHYAMVLGLPTAASVFDRESLDFLLPTHPHFVKIANTAASKDMIQYVPNNVPLVISTDDPDYIVADDAYQPQRNAQYMYCISQYPAKKEEYEKRFGKNLSFGISDHTTDFSLYQKYKPQTYEFHFRMNNSKGLDAGAFARTPEQCAAFAKGLDK